MVLWHRAPGPRCCRQCPDFCTVGWAYTEPLLHNKLGTRRISSDSSLLFLCSSSKCQFVPVP